MHDQNPDTDTPRHYVPRLVALQILADRIAGQRIAVNVSPRVVWVRLQISFANLKQRYARSRAALIPRLKPPGRPENLDLSYPAVYQESNGVQLRRETWRKAYPVEAAV